MKKLLALSLVLALTAMFAAPAMATEARKTALGNAAIYLEDDYNVFMFPATLVNYTGTAWLQMTLGEYNAWSSSCPDYLYCSDIRGFFGTAFGLGEDMQYGALALFLYQHTMGLNPTPYQLFPNATWSPGDLPYSSSIDNKFSLMYAYGAEGWSFGLGFERADEITESTANNETYKTPYEAYTKLTLSARFDAGENAYVDLGFFYGFANYTDDDFDGGAYGQVKEDANAIFGFPIRAFYEYSENLVLIPYFSFTSFDFSLKADSADFKDDYWGEKGTMIDFGIGTNYTINEDNLLLFAIDLYSYGKFEPSETPQGISEEAKFTVLPRFTWGLETDIKDWLTFRAGCQKVLVKEDYKSQIDQDKIEAKYTSAPFYWWLGLGFHVGDFDIDCLISKTLPFRMGYWLTGYGGGYYEGPNEAPIMMINALYHF
jgi:hypothetical protein